MSWLKYYSERKVHANDVSHPHLSLEKVIRLADGGKDTIENTLALCPNCHRELHFGAD
ncbi:HNH endonuclease signature motif containing protein [Vibrio vulnificus]|uniref:HNH endonuclease signature motif containing protein n=1 Tax=Vibrio vulnificus TaxID=672 RepID=UPI001F5E71E5|nr:HNH endonuclease signature motif containing protein [Vibrio vulnificus]